MNSTASRLAFVILLATFIGGCGSTPQEYDVTVTNKISEPVTAWITKNYGPYDAGWEPPEMLAANSAMENQLGGTVIAPGQTGHAKIVGKPDSGNPAVLRIYRATKIDAILSISQGSPDRVDYPMTPGVTDVDVTQVDSQLTAVPHQK